MDLGLLIGFVGTWALIIWSLLLGSSLLGYYDFPSVVLVVGGSSTIIFMTHPVSSVKNFFGASLRMFFPQKFNVDKAVKQLVDFAEIARREGILSLERNLGDVNDKFLTKGLQMAIDGTDPALIEAVLTADIDNASERHEQSKSVADALCKYAPAMGMIGTLVGLVVMLKNMDDPSAIGPGMACALLTTLYGSMIANGIFGPLADRMARRSGEEAMMKTIVMRGVLALQAGDNPRVVESKLRTFLPASKRESASELKLAA